MNNSSTFVGVYVDHSNITANGGYGLRYDILREFACHDNGEVIRLNTYVAYDEFRAKEDKQYHKRTNDYYSALRDIGCKVIIKKVKRYLDEDGTVNVKANADLDLAVDVLLQSERLDKVVLATGDGDFVQVVRALQNKGCRVELVAFDNVSEELRREVDLFVSGYLIPNLLTPKTNKPWGEMNSRVRGYCNYYDHERGFGFIRFLKTSTGNLWLTDNRNPLSPFESAFVHFRNLESSLVPELPNRNYIFEFDLTPGNNGFEARNIELCCPRP